MYKNFEAGRSMIEMLGVLAIVGVLSVGGIAGYSKAMEKWKTNKVLSEYSYLIYGLMEHLSDYQNLTTTQNYKVIGLQDIVMAAGIVPQTWTLGTTNSRQLYDADGNMVNVFSRHQRLVVDLYFGTHVKNDDGNLVSTNFSTGLCRELFLNLAKPLADTLHWARLYRNNESSPVLFWGNKTCNGADKKCLNSTTLSEIDAACKLCMKDDACCIGLEF